MTSSRCVVVVVVVVVVVGALFVSLRVSLPTQGEKGRGKKFAVFVKFCVSKVFREAKSEEGQDRGLRRPFLWRSKNQKKKSIAGFVNLQNRYA